MSLPFRYTIGLEVHVELSTQTKMFCRCKNEPFGSEPNTNTCPVCLGLPGTLPVPNKEAIRKTILVGKALGSTIPEFSKFDRKHYFYPDLPKGYQISQYDLPFCMGGSLEILGADGKVAAHVEFERVHLEEDAGKLMHGGKPGFSRVDLNRAGVPLIEMVSKPVIHSPEEARAFMQELRLVVRALGVSEADMEKGHMRCDANVSIQFEFEGKEVSSPITEIKNVNSTRGVERSLTVEAQRLYDEWMAGGPVRTRTAKITAGWDEDTGTVRVNRSKEAAKDYRYFPEPDIPPFQVYDDPDLNPDSVVIPTLPNQVRYHYLKQGLSLPDIELIINSSEFSGALQNYESRDGSRLKQAANWIINVPGATVLLPEHLEELLELAETGATSFSAVKPRFAELQACLNSLSGEKPVTRALKELGLLQVHDESVVQSAVAEVLDENPQAVQDFKDGKDRILGFLVGQVMKRTAGKAQPQKVQEAVREALGRR